MRGYRVRIETTIILPEIVNVKYANSLDEAANDAKKEAEKYYKVLLLAMRARYNEIISYPSLSVTTKVDFDDEELQNDLNTATKKRRKKR